MVYRNTALAAAVVILFGLVQLNDLLQATSEGPPWQLVVLGGLVLGIVITWTALASRLSTWMVIAINLVAAIIVSFRIATPETTTFLLPTRNSLTVMDEQMEQAFGLIRRGVEPVLPAVGLVVIVTLVLWAVGALAAYGIVRHRPSLAVIPGLVLILQFATMDRTPTSTFAILAFVAVVILILLAVANDERRATAGRMSHASGTATTHNWMAPGAAAGVAVLLFGTLVSVTVLDDRVPYDGYVQWRSATGLTGDFFGGVSYNPFVSIQQQLVEQTDTELFLARVSGDVEADRVYFRLLTMETYQNGQFFADRPEVQTLDSGDWESGGHAFSGPVATVKTDIQIEQLSQVGWMPAAYSPIDVSTNDQAIQNAVRVRGDDGSLLFDGGVTFKGMLYSATSEIPQPDLAALVANDDGELSVMFAEAAATSDAVPDPVLVSPQRTSPPNAERYLALPEELDEGIADLALEQTRGLETDFERGIALEAWFRSNAFAYTTDIPAGHGATDLADWLLDDESSFYRAGYCENFATSMAVMARTLEIPSRVVLGFTPGETFGQDDQGRDLLVVRDRNAHAWVELWMPAQGWVRFDPTPRPDEVNPATTGDLGDELGFDATTFLALVPEPGSIPLDPSNALPFDPSLIPDDNFDFDADAFDGAVGNSPVVPMWLLRALLALAALALLIGGIPALKWWRTRQRRRRLTEGDITAAWEEIVATLTDYGEEPAATQTPAEVAADVDPVMAPLAAVYGASIYGPSNGDSPSSAVATAEQALDETTERLQGRYSRSEKLKARYRPTSLLPAKVRGLLKR